MKAYQLSQKEIDFVIDFFESEEKEISLVDLKNGIGQYSDFEELQNRNLFHYVDEIIFDRYCLLSRSKAISEIINFINYSGANNFTPKIKYYGTKKIEEKTYVALYICWAGCPESHGEYDDTNVKCYIKERRVGLNTLFLELIDVFKKKGR